MRAPSPPAPASPPPLPSPTCPPATPAAPAALPLHNPFLGPFGHLASAGSRGSQLPFSASSNHSHFVLEGHLAGLALARRASAAAVVAHRAKSSPPPQPSPSVPSGAPPSPFAVPLSGESRPFSRSSPLRYNSDAGVTTAAAGPDPAAAYRSSLFPAMSDRSVDGTNQGVEDVVVSFSSGLLSLLSVLPALFLSGYLAGEGEPGLETVPSRFLVAGFAPTRVMLTCSTAALVGRALSPSVLIDDTIRTPVDSSADPVPSSIDSLAPRRAATTTAFIRLGCSLAVLLAWFDALDPEYLKSTRPSERLVVNPSDVLHGPAVRLQHSGAPAFFRMHVTESMRAERFAYNNNDTWWSHNHASVQSDRLAMDSALAKEVHLRTALLLDQRARFLIPTFLPTCMGIVPKKSGGMRIIADGTFVPSRGAVPAAERHLPRSVNAATNKHSVTTCRYGTCLLCMVYCIVNLRIRYPNMPIYFLLVDTVNAFKHCRLNFAVMPLLTAWIFSSLVVFTSTTFGAVWSPGEYSIVEELVRNTLGTFTIAETRKNRAALDFAERFRRPDPPVAIDATAFMRDIRPDAFSPGIDFSEFAAFLARVFVDDFFLLCMSVCADAFHVTLAALLWAKLVWFSSVSDPLRPTFVNIGKLGSWATRGKALGYILDTALCTIQVPAEKLEALRSSLRAWSDGDTTLSKVEIESTLGNIRFACMVLPMGAFLSARLSGYLTSIPQGRGRHSQRSASGQRAFSMPKDVRPEIEHLLFYLDPGRIGRYFTCPMERLLLRFPDFDCPSDASGFGCAGWCKQLRIGWTLVWPPEMLRFFADTQSVNVLEFIGVILNVAFMHDRLRDSGLSMPCCHFWTDNMAARAWAAAAHLPALNAAALARCLDVFISQSTMHMLTGHVAGAINIIADKMSRRPPDWPPENSALSAYLARSPTPFSSPHIDQVYTPPPDIVSVLLTAALRGTSPSVPRLIELTRTARFNIS